MDFRFVPAYDRKDEIAQLYSEYNALLLKVSPYMEACLAMQNFDRELDELELKFGQCAGGRLVLCLAGDEAAACVGIKRFDEDVCELKRLYVRPAFRGQGLGRKLTEMMLKAARECGYSRMYLDTLPGLESALRLYRAMGFYDIERYYDNPVPDAVYLAYDL